MTSTPGGDTLLPLKKIFHPTDFSIDSHTALLHALKLAAATKADLSIMHVDPEVARADFEDFPRISPILKDWKLLPPNTREELLSQAGVSIQKARAASNNPTEALLRHLAAHPADLLVMATHQHSVLERWQHRAVAEPVARGSHIPTLFVPTHVEGFVVKKTGEQQLRRVLIPVNDTPPPQAAIEWTVQLARTLGCERLTGLLIHVGDDRVLNSLHYPAHNEVEWRSMICHGDVVDVILSMGADFDVDLIVMPTEGHHSLLDMLRGSTMERVLRGARCPLLTIPALL